MNEITDILTSLLTPLKPATKSLPVLQSRECGECAACCSILGVHEIDKPKNTPCPHQTGKGCSVYENRPNSCRTYQCLWQAGAIEGDERRRPDNFGVIFDAGSQMDWVIVAREVLPDAMDRDHVQQFMKKLSRRVVIYCQLLNGRRKLMGPENLVREFVRQYKIEEKDKPDNQND